MTGDVLYIRRQFLADPPLPIYAPEPAVIGARLYNAAMPVESLCSQCQDATSKSCSRLEPKSRGAVAQITPSDYLPRLRAMPRLRWLGKSAANLCRGHRVYRPPATIITRSNKRLLWSHQSIRKCPFRNILVADIDIHSCLHKHASTTPLLAGVAGLLNSTSVRGGIVVTTLYPRIAGPFIQSWLR